MQKTSACVRRAMWETTVDNRYVKMAVLMEEGAWLPTDVYARTASPELSASETIAPGRALPQ